MGSTVAGTSFVVQAIACFFRGRLKPAPQPDPPQAGEKCCSVEFAETNTRGSEAPRSLSRFNDGSILGVPAEARRGSTRPPHFVRPRVARVPRPWHATHPVGRAF